MNKFAFLFFIIGFSSCIIVEEITYVDYVIKNNTNNKIELINDSFDFFPRKFHEKGPGIILPGDSLKIDHYEDGVLENVSQTPFEYIDSLQVVMNEVDTLIHYSENLNDPENSLFDEKNWQGGVIDEGRHHRSYTFRYVFGE